MHSYFSFPFQPLCAPLTALMKTGYFPKKLSPSLEWHYLSQAHSSQFLPPLTKSLSTITSWHAWKHFNGAAIGLSLERMLIATCVQTGWYGLGLLFKMHVGLLWILRINLPMYSVSIYSVLGLWIILKIKGYMLMRSVVCLYWFVIT